MPRIVKFPAVAVSERSHPPVASDQSAVWADPADWSSPTVSGQVWRAYCDALHERLVAQWAGGGRFRRALKTDLFDEAAGRGMVAALQAVATEVCGIDVSEAVVSRALAKNPGLVARKADVRALGLPESGVDFIFSNSTLDHFATLEEIMTALGELARVLAPGGRMIVSLDNPENPIVGLRNRLPTASLIRTELVPYFVGRTLSLSALCSALRDLGLTVVATRHLMHVPRVLALHGCRLVPVGGKWPPRLIRAFLSCEVAASWPTARFTGHFSAVLAVKPA